MLAIQRFKPRLQRLLAGDIREEDISLLFRTLRSISQKGSIVLEIGDLIAHVEGRDRGLTLDRIENRIASAEWCRRRLREGPPKVLDLEWNRAVKRTAKDYAENAPFPNSYGSTKEKFLKTVNKGLSRFKAGTNGDYQLKKGQSLHEKENHVLEMCTASAVLPIAFEIEPLMLELQDLLLKTELLDNTNTTIFNELENPIGLFIISLLHRTTIISGEKTFTLTAKCTEGEAGRESDPHPIKHGSVYVEAKHDGNDKLLDLATVFVMYGHLTEICEPDILEMEHLENTALELSRNGKLTSIDDQ